MKNIKKNIVQPNGRQNNLSICEKQQGYVNKRKIVFKFRD